MVAPQSAAPVLQHHAAPRASLDVPRSGGVTPGTLSPDQSRRGSVLVAGGLESAAAMGGMPLSQDQELRRERDRAEARIVGLKKSLAELAAFSSSTNRRLNETYYIVLQKLTALQHTILALKDLAHDSTTTNDGFIAESQSVLAEAQAHLDAFGDFSEQQTRVQALQDRVHGGRERIAALSARVDVVRQRVETWERADREWQEKTRRRLKIVWGFVMGLALALAVLYWGARAYAPEIEGVARELKQDALVAKMRLEHKAVGVGLGKAGDGDAEAEAEGEGEGEGNGSVPVLDFSRDERAERIGDEALRAFDEL